MSDAKLPPLPGQISTAGAVAPKNTEVDAGEFPELAQQPVDETPTNITVNFTLPIPLFNRFDETVLSVTGGAEGQHAHALMQAIELWIKCQQEAEKGNLMIFLSETGEMSHVNINNRIPVEVFPQYVQEFHQRREAAMIAKEEARANANKDSEAA